MNAIRVHNLSFEYQKGAHPVGVLKDISFRIKAGEMVAIRGPSGSGKSTLFYILGCLLKPGTGSVQIDGAEVSDLSDDQLAEVRNRKIGFIFQQFHLIPRATVLENILLPAQYPWETAQDENAEDRAHKIANQMGLSGRLDHVPNQLSGGQQQRVAIARALINNPSILLADEPTGNLDTASADLVLEEFEKLNRQGKTVIIITHDDEVARRCKRVLHIRDGRLTEEQDEGPSPETIRPRSDSFDGRSIQLRSGLRLLKKAFPQVTSSIRRNGLRSLLTMTGVTIGIAAVLSMITLGAYTREKILEGYASLGVNQLMIRGRSNYRARATGSFQPTFLAFNEENDLLALKKVFPEIKRLSPMATSSNASFTAGGRTFTGGLRVHGVYPEYFPILGRPLKGGRFFSASHQDFRSPVCVIGASVSEQVFQARNPIGEIGSVIINERTNFPCRVVGVLEARPSSKPSSPDTQVFVPISYLQSISSTDWESGIREFLIQIDQKADIALVAKKIEAYFSQKYGSGGRFNADSEAVLVDQMRTFLHLFSALLGAIAFLSLLVGGIGIHNMMLVSVAEQMRTIGLRKAVGATRRSIRWLFLFESVLLCIVAGIGGVVLGFLTYEGLIYLASKVIPGVTFEWVFDAWAVLVAGVSILGVGILSGLTPALRAEKLEVIEALRSE